MVSDGVDNFIEIGPGKTLTGFMKKIAPGVRSYHIGSIEEMEDHPEVTNA